MRKKYLPISIIGALIVQLILSFISSFIPSTNGIYGAPIPLGESSAFSGLISSGASHSTFSTIPFLLNVAISAILLFVISSKLSLGSGIVAVLGSLASLISTVVMYFRIGSGLPFAGIPIPLANYPGSGINPLLLWLNTVIIGALFAFIWRFIIRR